MVTESEAETRPRSSVERWLGNESADQDFDSPFNLEGIRTVPWLCVNR